MTENSGNSNTTEQTGTTGPGPETAGPTPGVNTDALKDVRTWRRTVDPDRKIAGVAGGMGRALNIDPTILRVLFVVLAFANGFGLLVYLVAWLLMPEEGQDEPIFKTSNWVRSALVFSAAVLAAVLSIALLGTFWAFGQPSAALPWPLVPIALVVIAIVWITQHKESRSMTQTIPPTTGDQTPPPPPEPGAPVTPAAPVPPSPRVDRGPKLFGFTIALLAIGLGILGIADQTGGSVPDAAYPALALAIVGGMFVVGSFFGRPGGLIFLGIVASIALAATATLGPRWDGNHDIQATPTSASDVQQSYDMGAGQVHIDLTQVRDIAALDGRTIDVNLNVGEVLIEVPDDLGVNITAHVRYGGAIDLPFKSTDGWGPQLTQVVNPDAATRVNLDITIRFGHIEVRNS